MRALGIYSLNNFHTNPRAALTVVPMLSVPSLTHAHLSLEVRTFTCFLLLPRPCLGWPQIWSFVLRACLFLDFAYKWVHATLAFLWLASPPALKAFNALMLPQMAGFPHFSWLNNIPLCVWDAVTCWWILGWFPCPGYCKRCFYEHGRADISWS